MTFVTSAPHTACQSRRDMEFTAALLQATLTARRIDAIVSKVFDGPQIESYEVALGIGVEPERVERLAGALAMAAGVSSCRIARVNGRLLIEIPKPDPERQILRASKLLHLRAPTCWHVALGPSTLGAIVWYNLDDERTCHLAIGGTTGSGKTNALHWLLRGLVMQNPVGRLQLLLADPKRRELEPFRLSRHLLHPVAHGTTEIVKLLLWLQDTMIDRAGQGIALPKIVMVVDEIRELTQRDRRVLDITSSIVQLGRGVGIHLVTTTQQPGAKALGEGLANFPARLLGRVASKTLTYGAAGHARSQAENLLGRGDMVLITTGGTMHRLQVPLVTEADLANIPRWESPDKVPRLELPEVVPWPTPPGVDTRGGWNRKMVPLEAVRRLVVEESFTASDLQRIFDINYHRAQRLVAQFGRGAETLERT